MAQTTSSQAGAIGQSMEAFADRISNDETEGKYKIETYHTDMDDRFNTIEGCQMDDSDRSRQPVHDRKLHQLFQVLTSEY